MGIQTGEIKMRAIDPVNARIKFISYAMLFVKDSYLRDLQGLVDSGQIKAEGVGKGRKYRA